MDSAVWKEEECRKRETPPQYDFRKGRSTGDLAFLTESRCTRLSTSSHPYSVHLSNARVNQYLHSFIPYTGKLWNSLSWSVSPPA